MWYNYAMKTSKQLERVLKGVSNHRRIEIILYIKKNPRASLLEISNALKANHKTISEHIRKLVIAGLVNKKYRGLFVQHTLSPYGKKIVKILTKF